MLLTFFVLLLLFLLTVCIGFLGISYILTPSSSDLPYATTYSSTLILLQQQLFSYYISTIIFCTFFATCCLFVISSKNRNMIIINMIRLEYINLSFFLDWPLRCPIINKNLFRNIKMRWLTSIAVLPGNFIYKLILMIQILPRLMTSTNILQEDNNSPFVTV